MVLILLILCGQVYAQSQEIATDTIGDAYPSIRAKPYEIAFAAASLNVKDEMIFENSGESSLELLNGALFRYRLRRLSLRFNASFFENESGRSSAKNFRIGPGLQWTPFLKKELLYVFMDCNYKSRRENTTILDVTSVSVNSYAVHARLNGLDMLAGLGTKLRIYKNFYCTVEAAYNQYFAKNKKQTVEYFTRQSSTQTTPYYFDTVVARLYFSLVF